MLVKSVWPKCNLKNALRVKKGVDSFWVECSTKETRVEILPLASEQEAERIIQLLTSLDNINSDESTDGGDKWKSASGGYCNKNNRCLHFLVSRDLESIMLFPWFYPISPHWGMDSPFIDLAYSDISSLAELKGLQIP